MEVAGLRVRVTFQRNEVVTDEFGNHRAVWSDYYSCFAAVGGERLEKAREKEAAGSVIEDVFMWVTVRFCRSVTAVTSTGFRVVLDGELYNIENIDHLGFRGKAVRFKCRRIRR